MTLSSIVGDAKNWVFGGGGGHQKPVPPPIFDYRSAPGEQSRRQNTVGMFNPQGSSLTTAPRAQDDYDQKRLAYLQKFGVDPASFMPSANSQQLQQHAGDLYRSATSFAPHLDMSAQQGMANQQQGLANMLMQRAAGQGSVTAEQLHQAGEEAAQQAYGLAQANSAYNPGMALQMGQNAALQARQQAFQQGRIGSLQEQQQAQGLYGALLGQMRGQGLQESDLGLQSQLQGQQLRQQGGLSALGAMQGLSEADRNALIAREELASGYNRSNRGMDIQERTSNRDFLGKIVGGIATAVGTAVAG